MPVKSTNQKLYTTPEAAYPTGESTIMVQENFSSKIGKSSSPSIQKVIANNKNVQAPLGIKTAVNSAFNKKPVK